jgi:hypothetical protein
MVIGVSAIVPLLILEGCSSSDDSGGSASPTGGSSASSPAAAAWAESVCTAADGLRTNISDLGTDLNVQASPSPGALDQVKAQLGSKVAAITASVQDLSTALAAVPTDLPGAEQVKASLDASANALKASVQTLTQQAQAVASASSATEALSLAGPAVGALQTAAGSVQEFATSVKTVTEQASGEVKSAFASAPSCAKLAASPSASSS